MKSLRKYKLGFSLIELIITISIISIIAGICILSINSYNQKHQTSTTEKIIAVLMRARSQSLNNMCYGQACLKGKPHGVHFENNKFTLFQGSDWYVDHDQDLDLIYTTQNESIISNHENIIFSELTGETNQSNTAIQIISETGKISRITLNKAGRINLEN